MAQQEEADALKLWAPVAGLTLSAFIFNTSEFIPIGLLSDIARDFQITESQAGTIITVYAWIVTVLSLPLMLLASKVEFKKLLLGILGLFVVSHFLSAVAPSFITLMLSRAGVAFSHSIFWSIASPLAVRIAPQGKRATALSLVVTGTAVAMIAGLPLGRMVGLYMGWRATFFSIGLVALAVAIFLLFIFPRVPANTQGSSVAKLPGILKNPALIGVYVLTALIFTANFTGYSYIEPFMAQVAHMPESEITFSLTLFGVAGILASIFFSRCYEQHPKFFFCNRYVWCRHFSGVNGIVFGTHLVSYAFVCFLGDHFHNFRFGISGRCDSAGTAIHSYRHVNLLGYCQRWNRQRCAGGWLGVRDTGY